MAKMLALYSPPGCGKSTSLMWLPPDITAYFDCDAKGLTWRGWREEYNAEKHNYFRVTEPEKVIKSVWGIGTSDSYKHIKYIVVDTVNNLMVSDEMRRCKEKGYDKWTDLAQSIWQLVELPAMLRDDLTLILLFHSQTERTEDGYEFTRIKTNGRKLERNDIDSKFNWLLRCVKHGDQYLYETTSHNSTSRTPLGAFNEDYIPNDIRLVLEAMKEY